MTNISPKKYILLSVLGIGLLFSGCKKDESTTPVSNPPVYKGKPINAVAHKQIQIPIIYKSTGETCYYCGDWGWQAWIDLADEFKGKALTWANYSSGVSNAYFRGQELSKNSTMEAFKNNFGTRGKPNFLTNGTNYETSTKNAKNAAAISLASRPNTIVSSASISGSWFGDTLLKVTAGVKFYKEATGEYYIGAYVIENKVIGPQAGPAGSKGNPEHHFVMRGSMGDSPWGEKLGGTSFKVNATMEKSFSAKIPSNYKKENINIGVVIWKKNGSKYEYVNAATNLK